jgi:filamentous hemagglutinin family protein
MKKPHREHALLVRRFLLGLSLFLAIPCSVSLAQEVTPITSSGLNTTVSAPITLPSGETQFNITDGTRPGGGLNLFHSFGHFDVPNNNIANFLNNSGLATSNILGRVTGGNMSDIFGSIQTTGFGNATLFLMNPAGFVFGPNATVNVGGIMTVTSADYLRLADNARFNAVPNAGADQLLSAAPIDAFGFLGSNPGAISVQGSHLAVAEGTGISLIGGNITIQNGTLTAPSGQINLVSVNKASNAKAGGEIGNGGEFAATGFKSLGTITLSQATTIDTSTSLAGVHPAGGVSIRGGQLVMDLSAITAITRVPLSAGSILVGGNVEVTAKHVTLSNHSSISTDNSGGGAVMSAAGNITFNARTLSSTDSTISALVTLPNAGNGGAVTIQGFKPGTSAATVTLTNTIIRTGTAFFGNGGPIEIRAHHISLNQSHLNTESSDPQGGPISLVSSGRIKSHDSSFNASSNFGFGGTIDLRAGTSINLTNTEVSAFSIQGFNGGSIALSAPRIALSESGLDVSGGAGGGGTISITGEKAVSLSGSVLTADDTSAADDPANAGTILINGGNHFRSDNSTLSAQSTFRNGGTIQVDAQKVKFADTQVTTGVTGGPQTVGGNITLDGHKVSIENSQILSTATEGQGGTINITSHNRKPVTNSFIDATSQFGTDGTVTIERR